MRNAQLHAVSESRAASVAKPLRGMLLACSIAVALSACAHLDAPDPGTTYEKAMRGTEVPSRWAASDESQQAAFQPSWIGFGDSGELAALIAEALEHNRDLQAAATRVESARLLSELAGARLKPNVDLNGRYSTDATELPQAQGYLSMSMVQMSWELDLWGMARAGIKSEEANLRSVSADYAYARESIAAAVARAWLLVIEGQQQQELAQRLEDDAREYAQLLATSQRIGKASELDVAQAEAQVHAYASAVRRWEQTQLQARRALEVLLGRYPSASIATREELPELDSSLPAGLPLALIERRPDLVAARQRFESAFFKSEQARVARLPNVMMTMGAGNVSSDYALFKGGMDKFVSPIGLRFSLPIFDGGRRQTVLEIRNSEQEQANVLYARTILRAMQEVENAMSAESLLALRANELSEQVGDVERTIGLAKVAHEVGKVDRFEILQREMSLYQARSTLLGVRSQRLAERVNLHLALGGSFSASTPG